MNEIRNLQKMEINWIFFPLPRRDGRVVEGGRLEIYCTFMRTGGSNPSLSAIPFLFLDFLFKKKTTFEKPLFKGAIKVFHAPD